MRLLICGDRNWDSLSVIYTAVCNILSIQWATGSEITWIIEGEAKGADLMGRQVAANLGIPIKSYPANWNNWGKSAGPIRNRVMLKEGNPDLILAFHDNISSSKGTKDMITIARRKGVPVWLINSKNEWVAWL